MNQIECYYFGCRERPGHHIWDENERILRQDKKSIFPFSVGVVDCQLLGSMPQSEGYGRIVHFDDWTVVTFFDYTVDNRPGSNSAFIVRGFHDLNSVIEISKQKFPWVWNRYSFDIRLAQPDSAAEVIRDLKEKLNKLTANLNSNTLPGELVESLTKSAIEFRRFQSEMPSVGDIVMRQQLGKVCSEIDLLLRENESRICGKF